MPRAASDPAIRNPQSAIRKFYRRQNDQRDRNRALAIRASSSAVRGNMRSKAGMPNASNAASKRITQEICSSDARGY
jgi:hypothetical protein